MSIALIVLTALYAVAAYKYPTPMLIASLMLCFFGFFAVGILSSYGVIIPAGYVFALIVGTTVAAVRFASRPVTTRF